VRRDRTAEHIFAEHLTRVDQTTVRAGAKSIAYSADAYHVGVEVRTEAQGEGGTGRGAIEEAATQVCRGMNGFVEFLVRHPNAFGGAEEVVISPVVFTTANLMASNLDLSGAELSTGNLERRLVHLLPKAYVMYQYHLSPGIQHGQANHSMLRALGDVLDTEFIRTVHFVGTAGIQRFLTFMSETIA
jgi:hypothetical protein